MPYWIVGLICLWIGGAFGFMAAAILAAGKRGDEMHEKARLRDALRDARTALWRCANDADAGSSEALAACLAIDKVLKEEIR